MKLLCPHCQQKLEAPPEMRGQFTVCPTCDNEFQIPAEPKVKECSDNPEKTEFCTFCGKKNEIGTIKCNHCHASLSGPKLSRHFVSCPQCNQKLRINNITGMLAKCPSCKKIFAINSVDKNKEVQGKTKTIPDNCAVALGCFGWSLILIQVSPFFIVIAIVAFIVAIIMWVFGKKQEQKQQEQ